MYVPAERESVRLRHLVGIYEVLTVYPIRLVADLIRVDDGTGRIVRGVAFHNILPLVEEAPRESL